MVPTLRKYLPFHKKQVIRPYIISIMRHRVAFNCSFSRPADEHEERGPATKSLTRIRCTSRVDAARIALCHKSIGKATHELCQTNSHKTPDCQKVSNYDISASFWPRLTASFAGCLSWRLSRRFPPRPPSSLSRPTNQRSAESYNAEIDTGETSNGPKVKRNNRRFN